MPAGGVWRPRAGSQEAGRALASVLARVEAVATVHRRLPQGPDVGRFDVAAFPRDRATDLPTAARRPDLRLELDLWPVEFDKDHAAARALVVSELVTKTPPPWNLDLAPAWQLDEDGRPRVRATWDGGRS